MKKTILVVEDDPSIAEVIQIILESEGFRVITDYTGELVLTDKLSGTPDLALVDYLLPVANGAEIVKALQVNTKYANLPIMMMSANTESELMQIAETSGITHVMPKPFDVEVLIKKVHDLLS